MISDKPMEEDGVKTEASDRKVTQQFVGEQVMLGVEALQQILEVRKPSVISVLVGNSETS